MVSGVKFTRSIPTTPLLVAVGEKSLGVNQYDDRTWRLVSEIRTKLINAGIPFYPTIERAARAARKMLDYYAKRINKYGCLPIG